MDNYWCPIKYAGFKILSSSGHRLRHRFSRFRSLTVPAFRKLPPSPQPHSSTLRHLLPIRAQFILWRNAQKPKKSLRLQLKIQEKRVAPRLLSVGLRGSAFGFASRCLIAAAILCGLRNSTATVSFLTPPSTSHTSHIDLVWSSRIRHATHA